MKITVIEIIVLLLLFSNVVTFGQIVDSKTIKNVGQNWKDKWDYTEKVSSDKYKITDYEIIGEDDAPCFVVLKMVPSGFIIVSSEKRTIPVLGCSRNGNFDLNSIPDGLKYLLECYKYEIKQIRKSKLKVNETTEDLWENLSKTPKSYNTIATKSEELKLLNLTTQWHQQDPYNTHCPDGVSVGCTAVAMGQIMKYHNFPPHGLGSHSYYWNGTAITENFTNTYDWQAMNSNTDEVAKLLYHCGVAVNMDYGGNSYAFLRDACEALNYHFGYAAEYKSSFTNEDLKAQIIDNCPVLFSGLGPVNPGGNIYAHAFILSGYKKDNYNNWQYYFNFGWLNGMGDGWFSLNDITPDISGTTYNFSYSQEAVFLKPAKLKIDFTTDKNVCRINESVHFNSSSLYKNYAPTSWEWYLNNDDTPDRTEENPTYTYSQPGIYKIKLKATNQETQITLEKEHFIYVRDNVDILYVDDNVFYGNGNGTEQSPYNLNYAAEVADNDDIIVLLRGTYNSSGVYVNYKSLTICSKYFQTNDYNDIIGTIINCAINFQLTPLNTRTVIRDLTFSDPMGLIWSTGSSIDFSNVFIVPSSSRPQSGITCSQGDYSFNNVRIEKCNHGINLGNASFSINNSILTNNQTSESGGAVYMEKSKGIIQNSLIFNNTAATGGGLYISNLSEVDLYSTTVANNSCSMQGGGGGLYNDQFKVNIYNSIFWNNNGGNIEYNHGSDCRFVIQYSDIQGGFSGTGNINIDPLFVAPSNGDFHLQSCSPCIDTGDPSSDWSYEPDYPSGHINMGAYGNTGEAEITAEVITTSQTWNSNKTLCGDLIIQSGTLTITSVVTMSLNKSVYVKFGAGLVLSGGQILNANVAVEPGGSINFQNNGSCRLNASDSFEFQPDGTFEMQYGTIDYISK